MFTQEMLEVQEEITRQKTHMRDEEQVMQEVQSKATRPRQVVEVQHSEFKRPSKTSGAGRSNVQIFSRQKCKAYELSGLDSMPKSKKKAQREARSRRQTDSAIRRRKGSSGHSRADHAQRAPKRGWMKNVDDALGLAGNRLGADSPLASHLEGNERRRSRPPSPSRVGQGGGEKKKNAEEWFNCAWLHGSCRST